MAVEQDNRQLGADMHKFGDGSVICRLKIMIMADLAPLRAIEFTPQNTEVTARQTSASQLRFVSVEFEASRQIAARQMRLPLRR